MWTRNPILSLSSILHPPPHVPNSIVVGATLEKSQFTGEVKGEPADEVQRKKDISQESNFGQGFLSVFLTVMCSLLFLGDVALLEEWSEV